MGSKDFQHLLLRIPTMNDDRFVELSRRQQVPGEAGLLQFEGDGLPVAIKPGLADPNDARVGHPAEDILHVAGRYFQQVVGMDPRRRCGHRVSVGEIDRLCHIDVIGTNDDDSSDARPKSAFENALDILLECLRTQMSVSVDPACHRPTAPFRAKECAELSSFPSRPEPYIDLSERDSLGDARTAAR